ncbi:MAG: HAD family phosphatase [Firmicutes bacterium]|nr:HAD family phosphatase [Bacillota bacterium]
MIKNVVFDLGNVLARFNLNDVLNSLTEDQKMKDDIFQFYFQSGLWHEYDHGLHSQKEMIEMGQERYPEYKEIIVQFMHTWSEFVLPIPSSMEVLEEYSQRKDCYILSNIPEDCFTFIKEKTPILKMVKGGVYSYQEKRIKPDLELYRILLNKYRLKASECLFIDDRIENVEAALHLGFQAIHLRDVSKLKEEIEVKLHEM